MRHRQAGRHLGRDTAHRKALYRNLVTDLLRYERITTTQAKAKEIRPMAEKIITLGKRGDLHARRQALRFVYDKNVVEHVFEEIAPRMSERRGGYLRITSLEPRKGDGAKMATIELVDYLEADAGIAAVASTNASAARQQAAAEPEPEPAVEPAPEPEAEVVEEPVAEAEAPAAEAEADETAADEATDDEPATEPDEPVAEADESPEASADEGEEEENDGSS